MLINDLTKSKMQLYAKNPAHGLIIFGMEGSGKEAVAEQLIREAFGRPEWKIISSKEGKAIGIEEIRTSLSFLNIKNNESAPYRVILIKNAELLTEEAQNALLKSLEEPAPKSAVFLLTNSYEALLPTIRSRTRALEVLPVSLDQAQKHFQGVDKTELTKNFLLSEGAAELLEALLENKSHPLREEINQAKQFLSASTFERLKSIETLKDTADTLAASILKISKTTLQNPKLSRAQRRRWIEIYELAADATKRLEAYVSKKTVLLELSLRLK